MSGFSPCRAAGDIPSANRRNIMEKAKDVRPSHDEFEPIELGSVSEETKGSDVGSEENIAGEVNTRL